MQVPGQLVYLEHLEAYFKLPKPVLRDYQAMYRYLVSHTAPTKCLAHKSFTPQRNTLSSQALSMAEINFWSAGRCGMVFAEITRSSNTGLAQMKKMENDSITEHIDAIRKAKEDGAHMFSQLMNNEPSSQWKQVEENENSDKIITL